MRRILAVFLAAILTGSGLPARAEEKAPPPVPERAAAAAIAKALGSRGLDILDETGIVVAARVKNSGRRILHVEWQDLAVLIRHAAALESAAALYEDARVREKGTVLGDLAGVRRIQALPTTGPITPAIKTALDVLGLHLKSADALGKTLTQTEHAAVLFDAPWARDYFERIHGAILEDFRPHAGAYFRDILVGPRDLSAAVEHFLLYTRDILGDDATQLLTADRTKGKASPKLEALIARYLLDQQRLWTAARTRERLRAIEDHTDLTEEMSRLRVVTDGLSKTPDLVKKIGELLKAEPPRTTVRFSGPDLHVRSEDGRSGFREGDSAVISMAYWIEGLGGDEKLAVTETGFFRRGGSGVSRRSEQIVKRKGAGPHVFTTRVRLGPGGRGDYHLALAAPGAATFFKKTAIRWSGGAKEAREVLPAVDNLISECELSEAGQMLADLESQVSGDKHAPEGLLENIRDRARLVDEQKSLLEDLYKSLAGVRLYASKDECRYRTDRAERALSILEHLPPGCDRLKAESSGPISLEVRKMLQATERRRLNQEVFRTAAAEARKRETACKFEVAGKMYASALALLDSDPEARCGAWEAEYTRIKLTDLPRAVSASDLAESIDKSIDDASRLFAKGDYSGALGIVVPLAAGIRALPDAHCYKARSDKADQFVRSAGLALGSDSRASSAALPKDSTGKEVRSVAMEYERVMRREHRTRTREDIRQSPLTPEGRP